MGRKSACRVAGLTLALFVLALAPAAAQSGDELFNQAGAALGANNAESAADLYGQAIRSGQLEKSKLSQAFLQRGRAYQLSGSHARAVADITNALWLETLSASDQARAHGWRASSRQALGQGSLAKDDLAKAKALDPQFAAAPASGTAVAARSPGTRGANGGEAQSEGLLDRLLSTGSQREEAAPARPAAVVTQPQRRASETVAARARQPEPADEPSTLGSLTQMGQGLLSGWFGDDEGEASVPAPPANGGGVAVRGLEPAAPARAAPPASPQGSDPDRQGLLSRILPTSQTAPASATPGNAVVAPRAKPQPDGDGAGPVRLVNLEREQPSSPPSAAAPARSGIMESLFGTSTTEAPAPVRAPTATPEIITYSESRVASAPPWTLGADNASSREERAQLPDIPRRPVIAPTPVRAPARVPAREPARAASPQPADDGPTLFSNIVPSISSGTSQENEVRTVRVARSRQNWMAPRRARSRETREPQLAAIPAPAPAPAPQPVQVAAASIPDAQPSQRLIPAPQRAIPAAPRAIPAAAPAPVDARAANSGALDWDEATQVGAAPVRATVQAPAVVASRPSAARVIPAPRRAPQPRATVAQPVQAPAPQPVNIASLDWDSATQIRAVPAPAPAPVQVASPAPAAAPARAVVRSPYVATPRDIPAPPQRRVVTSQPVASPPPANTQQPVGGSVTSRIFEVASQAFSGTYQTQAQAPAQNARRFRAESRRANSGASRSAVAPAPPASSGRYAVQLFAQRTQAEAEASAASIQRRHGDLFAGAKPFVVRAEVPGKGTFYRVRVGPYAGNQSANSICQQLKGRGADCFAVRL